MDQKTIINQQQYGIKQGTKKFEINTVKSILELSMRVTGTYNCKTL